MEPAARRFRCPVLPAGRSPPPLRMGRLLPHPLVPAGSTRRGKPPGSPVGADQGSPADRFFPEKGAREEPGRTDPPGHLRLLHRPVRRHLYRRAWSTTSASGCWTAVSSSSSSCSPKRSGSSWRVESPRPSRGAASLRPAGLGREAGDLVPLLLLGAVALTGFFVEALRIAATHPAAAPYSYAANAVARLFARVGIPDLLRLHRGFWWVHLFMAFGFLASIPYGKMLHGIAGPANIFLRSYRPAGTLQSIPDFDSRESDRGRRHRGFFLEAAAGSRRLRRGVAGARRDVPPMRPGRP